MQKYQAEKTYMNTLIRISVVSNKGTVYTQNKIEQAFDKFDHVVKSYTRFNDESELARLNKSSGKPYKVSNELFHLVEKLLHYARISDGDFDPTVIDLLEMYGYDKNHDFSKLDNPKLYDEIQKLVKNRKTYKEIKLDMNNITIELAPGQRLDLGSIGKGYAIDLAYDVLSEFSGFIINAGGDIRAKGRNEKGKFWQVGLMLTQLPNKMLSDRQILGHMELANKSLAGSGGWVRKIKFFHHLLNTKTGLPVNDNSQAYVLANTATEADTLCTVLFVGGVKALDTIKAEGAEGLLVNANGEIFTTSGFKYYH